MDCGAASIAPWPRRRRRSGYPSLSADEPQFVTDAWMTAEDGYRFVLPKLVEMAPRIYVAQGYDFADFAFVLTGRRHRGHRRSLHRCPRRGCDPGATHDHAPADYPRP